MNLWSRLADLLPAEPLLAGSVLTQHGDGTSSVQLPDGAIIRVRGITVAVGARAFVRAGAIEGPAPELPLVSIEL